MQVAFSTVGTISTHAELLFKRWWEIRSGHPLVSENIIDDAKNSSTKIALVKLPTL